MSGLMHMEVGGAPVIVCYGPKMKEHSREPMGVRWCFKCRSRNEFHWVLMVAEIEYDEDGSISSSMYMAEPSAHSECSGCKRRDGQLFPGWVYRWEDE